MSLTWVTALGLLATVTACTGSSPAARATPTSTVATAMPVDTAPLSTAPVTEKPVSACPYVSRAVAIGDAGFRLDRITGLTQAGRLVGCRFYPPQHPTAQCGTFCLAGEHLPPATVPAIEIRATAYSSAQAAHNAFVTTADAGTNYQQERVGPGNTGVCFQTTVWARDRGTDWACAFSAGSVAVVIRTVVTTPALDVAELARAVAAHL